MKTKNLKEIANEINLSHYNELLEKVNNHKVKLAVNENSDYGWHIHPNSDEILLVTEGILEVELPGNKIHQLSPGQLILIPMGTSHRTSCKDKTVNICFEKQDTETVFLTENEQRLGDISGVWILDINAITDKITESHKKIDLIKVNDHKLVLAVNQGSYFWHNHPNSDELFLVWKGLFNLTLDSKRSIQLQDLDFIKIPKKVNHYPVVPQRTITVFFESSDIETNEI
jgi:quercetin dioxygenase-like cupin family protein